MPHIYRGLVEASPLYFFHVDCVVERSCERGEQSEHAWDECSIYNFL